jgi:hypothetical protein
MLIKTIKIAFVFHTQHFGEITLRHPSVQRDPIPEPVHQLTINRINRFDHICPGEISSVNTRTLPQTS